MRSNIRERYRFDNKSSAKSDNRVDAYQSVILGHNMRVTDERMSDFRGTMNEIISVSNGRQPKDKKDLDPDYYGKKMPRDLSPIPTKTLDISLSKLVAPQTMVNKSV